MKRIILSLLALVAADVSVVTAHDYYGWFVYAANGNILSRKNMGTYSYDASRRIRGRFSDSPNWIKEPPLIPNMSYEGNMLTSVRDDASRQSYAGATDFDGVTGREYPLTYNAAGALVSDAGRKIAKIDYDWLNNPVRIQFTNGNVTKYIYSTAGEKLRVTHQTAVPNITVAIGSTKELAPSEIQYTDSTDYLLGGSLTLKNGRIDKYQFDEGYCQADRYANNTSQDNFTFCYYDRDHLGNVRQVTKADGSNKGTVIQTLNYYPFGAQFCDGTAASDVQPYKYNGKELDLMHGLNTYDYGARQYDPILARWDRMDPLCEKYYSISPFAYCAGDPVNHIDPDGRETHVTINADGTYRIIGGVLNDDRNIYVYSQDLDGNYSIRGESIGITSSTTSFYDSDQNGGQGAWAIGSIINPNDNSGRIFLNKIASESTTLDDYIDKARNDHQYDFKVTNGSENVISRNEDYIYRGMSIGNTAFGQTIYSSARDIGNMAAGIVAAKNGIPWGFARLAFDAYQSRNGLQTEGLSTRNAEYYGWSQIYSRSNGRTEGMNLINSISSFLSKIWRKIF